MDAFETLNRMLRKANHCQKNQILMGVYKQLASSRKGREASGPFRDYVNSHPLTRREFVAYVAEKLDARGLTGQAFKLVEQYRLNIPVVIAEGIVFEKFEKKEEKRRTLEDLIIGADTKIDKVLSTIPPADISIIKNIKKKYTIIPTSDSSKNEAKVADTIYSLSQKSYINPFDLALSAIGISAYMTPYVLSKMKRSPILDNK